ncbi:hypothetical protein [Geminocystis sp. NIES-3709]|uniref:hypothetical protein n=1 Tax=Geminocystis sp. NIES-3709 TaxID=1617448 RepID=UPI0018D422AA|nr:hypothetical protein [Geminocystis sp. NIES-3709]
MKKLRLNINYSLSIVYMNLPVVSHSDYVTPLPDRHRFSMPKFKLLYELLLKDAIITSQ